MYSYKTDSGRQAFLHYRSGLIPHLVALNFYFEAAHKEYGLHPLQNGGKGRTQKTGSALYSC